MAVNSTDRASLIKATAIQRQMIDDLNGNYMLDTYDVSACYVIEAPHALQQAIIYFSDADRAFEYAKALCFPDGVVTCPRCGSDRHSFVKTRKLWHCKGCKKQFTLKVGTIFEDSPLGSISGCARSG